jgi:hypothetical protein
VWDLKLSLLDEGYGLCPERKGDIHPQSDWVNVLGSEWHMGLVIHDDEYDHDI